MDVFAREVAALLLQGDWKGEAMHARLVAAYGAKRPWMERLVTDVLRGPPEQAEEHEEREEEDEEREQEDEEPEQQDEEQEDEDEEREEEDDEREEEDEEQENEPAAGISALDDLAGWLPLLYSFREAVRERPLMRRWAERPAMRESPWRVPALATTKELAVWLGIGVDALIALADERGIANSPGDERRRNYRYTWIAKRGGHRLLEASKPRLRQVQRYILDDIVAHIPPHPAAHGFRTAHSIATFAEPHVRRDVVIRLDLQAFFTSVFRARVVAIFRAAGYPERVAHTLAALCTHRTPSDVLHAMPRQPRPSTDEIAVHALTLARLRAAHLPQGAPTSGALANLAAYGFDVRVHALTASLGASYTRYADDIAISGGRELARAAPTIIARVGAIAFEEGFALNFRKTRVMTASTQQRITGLVVNDRLAVPRVEVERLRAILHNCVRTGPAAQNRDSHPDFRAHLLGRVAWVASVDARKGARLRAVFDRIAW